MWERLRPDLAGPFPPCRQSPGPARVGAVPRGSGGRLAVANYLCESGRLHVHTQLPIIYVGYTNNYQLFMYIGASAAVARYRYSNHPSCMYVKTARRTHTISNCLCRSRWPSAHTHTITNCLRMWEPPRPDPPCYSYSNHPPLLLSPFR